MISYIFRRILYSIFVLWIIITITFILMHAIPGGPFTKEKELPQEILKNIEARYKLNQPLYLQYLDYLKNLIKFDLGPSFKYEDRTVNEIIKEGFPVSCILGISATCLAVITGISFGIISALKHNNFIDRGIMLFATFGVSIPNFIIATILMFFFSLKLKLFPAGLWEGFSSAVLPVISLSLHPTAFIARLSRSSLIEVLNQDYIRVARAKGFSWSYVIYKHALKNSLTPVVSYLGPLLAGILTGSFVVETIFAIPGLGKYFVTSIYNRDYTTILGVTVFYSALLIFLNLIVDIVYVYLDPRIRYTEKEKI